MTCTKLGTKLSSIRDAAPGVQNLYDGYVVGGANGSSIIKSVDKFNFVAQACTSISATLPVAVYYAAGTSTVTPSLVAGA